MKKIFCFFLVIMITTSIFMTSAFADNKTVQLGETGISFQIDSSYDVITNNNKKDYSQEIQRQINEDNEMMLYSATQGSIFVMYDQGNDFLQYNMSGKKSEEIVESYTEYFKALESVFGTTDYEVTVYDSGRIKWAKVDVPSISLVWFITCQEKRMVSVYYNSLIIDNKTIHTLIDSFSFGSPSFWSKVKNLAGSITNLGRKFLGGYGVYVIWAGIVSIILYVIGSIFEFIGSQFKRKRNHSNKSQLASNTPSNHSTPKKINDSPNILSRVETQDEEYIKYIMSNNPSVRRDDIVSFLSVVDVYDRTGDKQKTLDAFDAFIMPIVSSDTIYASMASGFFCGLLGNNISLSDSEVNALSDKYNGIIKQRIRERSGIVSH